MRLVAVSVAMIAAVAILSPSAVAGSALAVEASASPATSPSASVAPSPSVAPASVTLAPRNTLGEPQTWSIDVIGGSPSVDVLELDDSGSGFSVTVFGQAATVQMTVTLPAGVELEDGICFHVEGQANIDALVAPDRLVLDVVPGHTYECAYFMTFVNRAAVIVHAPTREFDAARTWAIAVTGGRPSADALVLSEEAGNPARLFGSFFVTVDGPSATVEMTVPLPPGAALVSATCSDEVDTRAFNVLVPPRRLVLDVIPLTYSCEARARQATLPPTDTLAEPRADSSHGWTLTIAALALLIASTVLVGVRARR